VSEDSEIRPRTVKIPKCGNSTRSTMEVIHTEEQTRGRESHATVLFLKRSVSEFKKIIA
jgi:hypothetical protein